MQLVLHTTLPPHASPLATPPAPPPPPHSTATTPPPPMPTLRQAPPPSRPSPPSPRPCIHLTPPPQEGSVLACNTVPPSQETLHQSMECHPRQSRVDVVMHPTWTLTSQMSSPAFLQPTQQVLERSHRNHLRIRCLSMEGAGSCLTSP